MIHGIHICIPCVMHGIPYVSSCGYTLTWDTYIHITIHVTIHTWDTYMYMRDSIRGSIVEWSLYSTENPFHRNEMSFYSTAKVKKGFSVEWRIHSTKTKSLYSTENPFFTSHEETHFMNCEERVLRWIARFHFCGMESLFNGEPFLHLSCGIKKKWLYTTTKEKNRFSVEWRLHSIKMKSLYSTENPFFTFLVAWKGDFIASSFSVMYPLYAYICIYVYMYIYTYTYIYMYINIICIFPHSAWCTHCMHIYAYMYTYIYTHIRIHICINIIYMFSFSVMYPQQSPL